MSLYLANPSTQRHHFHFREPVNNLVQIVELESGHQTAIGHSWDAKQKAKVIQQLERRGARDAGEVKRSMGRFSGLIYRDMGEIKTDEIEMANASEMQTREDRAVAAATNGALGFDRTVRAKSKTRPSAKITETHVIQDIPTDGRVRGNEVAFDLTVDPDGRSDIKLPN